MTFGKALSCLCNSQRGIMFSILVWSLQIFGHDLLRRIQFIKHVSLLAFFDKLTLPRPASIDASLVVRTGTH